MAKLRDRLKSSGRRLRRGESGVAAIEFAFILPVMVLLFFGSMEGSELFTVKRRVVNATNALADLVTQEPTVRRAEIADAIIGVRRLLEPTDTSTLTIRVLSVVKGPNTGDPVTVHWSIDDQGGTPYAAGSTYTKLEDNGAVRPESSLVVVEMNFNYVSSLGGRVFSKTANFEQQAKRWPRKSVRVQLCTTTNPATCTS